MIIKLSQFKPIKYKSRKINKSIQFVRNYINLHGFKFTLLFLFLLKMGNSFLVKMVNLMRGKSEYNPIK